MYHKSGADCCAETEYRDETADVTNTRQCDVTPYVTPQPPAQPARDVDQLASCSERRIIRCSVCATVVTSRSDGDVTAGNDQSRRGISSSPVHDDVNVPV